MSTLQRARSEIRTVLRVCLLWLPLWLSGPNPSSSQVPVLSSNPSLERLEPMIGIWRGRVERQVGGDTLVLEPILTFEWGAGGVWLHGEQVTELAVGTLIEERIELTWHPRGDEYRGVWLDNVAPAPTAFRGRWTEDGALRLDSGEVELGGRKHRVISVYRSASATELELVVHQSWDGETPRVVAQGRFERVHARARQLENPLQVFAGQVGDWVSREWEPGKDGNRKRTVMETRWNLGETVLTTRQFAEYESGERELELEERVWWDPRREVFATVIHSTQGWIADARYLDLGDGLRRLDCEVLFRDGREMEVIDTFQTLSDGTIRWKSFFVQEGKKTLEPVGVYTLERLPRGGD